MKVTRLKIRATELGCPNRNGDYPRLAGCRRMHRGDRKRFGATSQTVSEQEVYFNGKRNIRIQYPVRSIAACEWSPLPSLETPPIKKSL